MSVEYTRNISLPLTDGMVDTLLVHLQSSADDYLKMLEEQPLRVDGDDDPDGLVDDARLLLMCHTRLVLERADTEAHQLRYHFVESYCIPNRFPKLQSEDIADLICMLFNNPDPKQGIYQHMLNVVYSPWLDWHVEEDGQKRPKFLDWMAANFVPGELYWGLYDKESA